MKTRTVKHRAAVRRLAWQSMACLPLLAAATSSPAAATAAAEDQDFTSLSLQELGAIKIPTVIGASKHEQKITDAPSSVSIVTQQDIKEYGYRTLADILNGVRGLYVTFDRGYNFLGVRGVNRLGDFGGRTLVNINGHRLNEPIYDSSFLGYDFPLDVDLIERVEVIRGPGSSLYGNNAFFGIVNVVTRDGRSFAGNGVETTGIYGQWDTFSGRFSYGHHFTNGVELMLSGTYYQSDGNPELEFPSATGGAAPFPGATVKDYDRQSAYNFFGTLSYEGFTLQGLYGRRDKELPNGPYGADFQDRRNELWDERAFIEARYTHDFANDWHLLARTYIDHYTYEGTYVFDPGSASVNRDVPRAEWWGGEIQLSKTLWDRHRVTAGFEGRYDWEQHQENYDTIPSPGSPDLDINRTVSSLGAYLQDEWSITRGLTLNAGVRYDYFSTFGGTVNPRAAVIYQPWESSSFKALYGQAYRAPSAYEQDFETTLYQSNDDLQPEKIRSYELVYEQGIAKNYSLSGTFFYNQIEDLITLEEGPASDPRGIFRNTDSVDVTGGAIEVEARWKYGVRARASYTYARAVDNATDSILNNSPRHVGKLQLTVPLYPKKITAGLELLTVSDRETAYGHTEDGHVLANLTLFSHNLIKNLEFSASLYNLFDTRYYDPASPDFTQDLNPQDGRTFRVKLTYKF
ncbi:MAG: hypothetical protein RJA22_2804 [Verrucomicrobiota bacterium]